MSYSSESPPVYFYLPSEDFPTEIPLDADHYWTGFRRGIYCWTLQTYLHLKNSGFPCQLVSEIPENGIIFAHWDSLPPGLKPLPQQLIVCFQADRARHLYAQVHIVQNPEGLRKDLMLLGDRYLLIGQDYYMPHWPQPGLIPRSKERGDQFENLCFLGLELNLLPEFKETAWHENLKEMGISWQIISSFELWNDYSEIDAILAVRSFQDVNFTWKPATKLYNAWHAGIPAILGRESAYRAERKSKLDYIEVRSIADTLQAIRSLKENRELRCAMSENAQIRAQETSKEKLIAQWTELIQLRLVPYYYRWSQSSLYRQSFTTLRQLSMQTRQDRKNLQKIRNQIGLRTFIKGLFR